MRVSALIPRILLLLVLVPALPAQTASTPTVKEAEDFMKQAEARLGELSVKVSRAAWVEDNFITVDTEALAADAQDQITALTTDLVEQAKRFDGLKMPPDLARKFMLLRLALTAPAPRDPTLRREMTQIAASLEADYGKGKYCRKPDDCLDITAIERVMASSRDPKELQDLWTGWHAVGAAHAPALFTLCGTVEPRRARNWLQRCGRDVALQLRHAA